MKRVLFLIFISLKVCGQSVELKPGSNGFVMIPNVNTLSSCGVADKGKIVYYSIDNTLRMCNGSNWVNFNSGLSLPFSSTSTSDISHFNVRKNNVSSVEPAISAYINSTNYGAAILGYAENSNPIQNTYAIHGINYSSNGFGSGVYGIQYGSGSGVKGEITGGLNGNGVYGNHNGGGSGVYGRSSNGNGVSGFSQFSNGGSGVYGLAFGINSKGINGYSENGYGFGVYGSAESGIGVKGYALNFNSTNGIGGHFSNASSTGYALITGTGLVGIGTETPAAKLDIKGTSYLSHFYYDTSEDTYIRGGKAGSKVLINDITGMGNVGIGLPNPSEILDVNGRLRIRHKVNTAGMWFSNSANSLNSADGAFYGMKNDTETGFFIGNTWRFWVDNNGNTTNSGFTKLGNSTPAGAALTAIAPAIKTMVLYGTTSDIQGGSASVTHGLSLPKILSYTVLVNTGLLISPEYTGATGHNYNTFCTGSAIFVNNSSTNSSAILNKSFRVFLTYSE